MRRYITISVVSVVIMLFLVGIVLGAAMNPGDTYTASGDTYTASTGPERNQAFGTDDDFNLEVNSGDPNCESIRTTYLRWDLTGVNRAAGPGTKLKLSVNDASVSNTGSLSLFQVSDDDWNEATLKGSNTSPPPPTLGSVITLVSNPTDTEIDGQVIFKGQDLADWINANSLFVGADDSTAGNDKVSFAIEVTGCTGDSNSTRFDSKESYIDNVGTPPDLKLFDTNNVTLTTLRAEGGEYPLNWPLYACIGLATLAAAALLVAYRRRTLDSV